LVIASRINTICQPETVSSLVNFPNATLQVFTLKLLLLLISFHIV